MKLNKYIEKIYEEFYTQVYEIKTISKNMIELIVFDSENCYLGKHIKPNLLVRTSKIYVPPCDPGIYISCSYNLGISDVLVPNILEGSCYTKLSKIKFIRQANKFSIETEESFHDFLLQKFIELMHAFIQNLNRYNYNEREHLKSLKRIDLAERNKKEIAKNIALFDNCIKEIVAIGSYLDGKRDFVEKTNGKYSKPRVRDLVSYVSIDPRP